MISHNLPRGATPHAPAEAPHEPHVGGVGWQAAIAITATCAALVVVLIPLVCCRQKRREGPLPVRTSLVNEKCVAMLVEQEAKLKLWPEVLQVLP